MTMYDKKDLKSLIARGTNLGISLFLTAYPDKKYDFVSAQVVDETDDQYETRVNETLAKLEEQSGFRRKYMPWYNAAREAISIITPSSLREFDELYLYPRTRKSMTATNFTVSDYLKYCTVTGAYGTNVSDSWAYAAFDHQLRILSACEQWFDEKIFKLKEVLRADVYATELDKARAFLSKGYIREAVTISGVVLEGHLEAVALNRGVKLKAKATLGPIIDDLRKSDVISVTQHKQLLYLGDIRNKGAHRGTGPTGDEAEDMLQMTAKVMRDIN